MGYNNYCRRGCKPEFAHQYDEMVSDMSHLETRKQMTQFVLAYMVCTDYDRSTICAAMKATQYRIEHEND